MILADTDVLIEIFDKNSNKGAAALHRIEEAGEDISLTSLNLHEILFSARLEVKAEKKGNKIPRFDAMIAAVAINRGFKLFTFNKDHFEGFEELELF